MVLNFKQTYKAFTLWEMMIALLITSLVVTMSYGAYRTLTGVLKKDQQTLNDVFDIMMLERDLHRLTDSCMSIELLDDVLYFNHRDSYAYLELGDSTLIWGEEHGEDEQMFQIVDWSVVFLDDQSEFVKTVRISFQKERLSYNFSLRKVYPRVQLYFMKRE